MKNKNIKLIIIPLTIVTIITCIVISMQTYSQYKKISVISISYYLFKNLTIYWWAVTLLILMPKTSFSNRFPVSCPLVS